MRVASVPRRMPVLAGSIVIAGALTAGTALPVFAQAANGSVTGTVTDATSGEPVANAHVDVNVEGGLAIAETDASGVFLAADLPVGPAVLTVQAIGYAPYSADIVVEDGVELNVDVALTPVPTADITGEVFDSENMTPIPGAFINVLVGGSCTTSGGLIAIAESGDDGSYTVEDIDPGPAVMSVDADGYKLYQVELELVAGELSNVVLVPMVAATSEEPSPSCASAEDDSDGELPFTGVDPSVPLLGGALSLLMGAALLARSHRTSRR